MAFDPKSQITRNDPRYAQHGGLWTENGEWNQLDPWLNDPGLLDSYWRSLGYTGQVGTQATDQADPQMSPELRQWLAAQGYQNSTDGGQSNGYNALMDASGNVVPGSEYGNRTNDDAMFIAGMLGLGGVGYAAGAFGGGSAAAGAGAGNASTAAMANGALAGGATGAGVGGAAAGGYGGLAAGTGAMYADAGSGTVSDAGGGYSSDASSFRPSQNYGEGMTGGETGAYDTAIKAGGNMAGNTGNTSLADFFSGNGNWNDYLRAGQAAYGMYSQNKATDAAMQGNANQLALQREMWLANQAENKPLVDMRNSVLPQIQNLLQNPSSITSQPGYQFQLKQGQNALNNRAAASGNYYSGAQMKAAQQYGQDYAGTKLDQSLNRLMGVATGTQVGSQNNQSANNQFAVSGGNALQQGGNIRAGGYIGQYNTVNNNLNDWMQDQTNRKYWGGGG